MIRLVIKFPTRDRDLFLPPEETSVANLIFTNLQAMIHYANEARDCVTLYDALSRIPDTIETTGWAFIPAKQLILSIYNYRMAQDAVHSATTRRSKQIVKLVDTKRLEIIKAEFRDAFPHTRELRQSIMHLAELKESEKRVKATALKRDQVHGVVLIGAGSASQVSLIDNRLQMTFAGHLYFQPVTGEVVDTLFKNVTDFIRAFAGLGVQLDAVQRQ